MESLFFFLRFYLLMKDTEERERQRHRQREKQAACREPNMGFDPATPGSHPGPKAGLKLVSHPGVLISFLIHEYRSLLK